MSIVIEICPCCQKEFQGHAEPKKAGENALLTLRTHMWLDHPAKLFRCPKNTGSKKSAENDFIRSNGLCSYCGGEPH